MNCDDDGVRDADHRGDFRREPPATDPVTFTAAIGLFFCAAFVAALVPTVPSFRVDPAGALRHE